MKIYIHTQYYLPEVGAPQRRLSELVHYLVQNNHDVCILTSMPNYPTGKIFRGYSGLFKIEYINNVKIIRSYIYPTKSIHIIPRLLSYFSFVCSSLIVGLFKLKKSDYFLLRVHHCF